MPGQRLRPHLSAGQGTSRHLPVGDRAPLRPHPEPRGRGDRRTAAAAAHGRDRTDLGRTAHPRTHARTCPTLLGDAAQPDSHAPRTGRGAGLSRRTTGRRTTRGGRRQHPRPGGRAGPQRVDAGRAAFVDHGLLAPGRRARRGDITASGRRPAPLRRRPPQGAVSGSFTGRPAQHRGRAGPTHRMDLFRRPPVQPSTRLLHRIPRPGQGHRPTASSWPTSSPV